MEEKQAQDILLLDIREQAPFADYFVIATATSERQSKSLVDTLVDTLRQEARIRPLFIEGESYSGWQLLDYGQVIVHIFSPELRDYYRLEELWRDARVVVHLQ